MALQDTDISKVRTILLGLTGLSCLLYAISLLRRTRHNRFGGLYQLQWG